MSQIKFMKYYVTNGKDKARVWYSLGILGDGRECITLYEKDYTRQLHKIFPKEAINESDSMTDYFEQSHVRIFKDNPLYPQALVRVKQ